MYSSKHRRVFVLAITAISALTAVVPAVGQENVGRGAINIALIGDSYSAGNGTGPNAGSGYFGPRGCYRSDENWAQRYRQALTKQGYHVTFVNHACSGATTEAVTKDRDMGIETFVTRDQSKCPEPKYPEEERLVYVGPTRTGRAGRTPAVKCQRFLKPQVSFLNEETDLVFFTFGGNNVHFDRIVAQCFAPGYRDPLSCRTLVEDAFKYLRNGELRRSLKEVLVAIDGKVSKDTKIVMLPYPHLVIDNNYQLIGYEGSERTRTPGWSRPVSRRKLIRYDAGNQIRSLNGLAEQEQYGALTDQYGPLGTKAFLIQDMKEYFRPHETDGDANKRNVDRWLNEFFEPTVYVKADWYHPNTRGHEEFKNLLMRHGIFGADHALTSTTGSIDLVFVIDTTSSMQDDINAVKAHASRLVDDIDQRTRTYRVAIVDYRDFPDRTDDSRDYPSHVALSFSSDKATILSVVNGLGLGSGGDESETMWSGLREAIQLPWREGVKKVVIQFGDAPPLDPEPNTGLTEDDIVREALAVDPAQVYVVDVSSGGSSSGTEVRSVATRTNGRAISATDPAAVDDALQSIVDEALSKPFAWVGQAYVTKVGSSLAFDGSGSYDADDTIEEFEWDFDNDGTYDETTTTPSISHTYTSSYDGLIALRVTDNSGLTGVATAKVRVTADGDEVNDEVDNCPDIANSGQEDQDGDGLGDACDTSPGFLTRDKPGVRSEDNSRSASTGVWWYVIFAIASTVTLLVVVIAAQALRRRAQDGTAPL